MVFSKEEWRRHPVARSGDWFPAGVDELLENGRSGGVELEGFGVGRPARQGDQFDLARRLVSRPVARVLAPLQKLQCCPVLLATDLDDFWVSPVKRHGMGSLFFDGDKEEGQLRAGHGFHSIDVERRLDVVAKIGDGARKTSAAGIDTALEIDHGRPVEPVRDDSDRGSR
jgi:hypothetical protein